MHSFQGEQVKKKRPLKPILPYTYSLLAKRSYFSKQLEKKLLEKGYTNAEIKKILIQLRERGWINDQELAERYVEQQTARGYGPRVIQFKLREKAGDISIPIEESLSDVRKLVEKKYSKDLPEKRQKVVAALARRGHSFDLINKVLTSISEE